MAHRALARLNALLKAVESMPTEARLGGLWLALQALDDPQLIPYVADPLLPLEGAFLSLDSQLHALQAASASLPVNAGGLGTIWGALYLPAQQKARTCRVAVAALSTPTELGWPLPEPVAPMSPSVARSAAAALREALALIERVGMPPPRPVHLLYGVEEGLSAAGDSLGLPLFLATLSALTGLPLRPHLGATGALTEGALCAVHWTEAKRSALQAEGIILLSHSEVGTLAEAAAQALEGGEGFRYSVPSAVPPLVSLPTFLVADVELSDLLGARDDIAAFERTVCAALERQGGFLYRRQAAVEEGIRAVFATPEAACAAGVAVQQALARCPWPEGCAPLLARIGLYQGSAERVRDGYFGAAPGMAFRLMQAAHAGQILLPQELATEVTLVTAALGIHRLRDLSMALNLCRLDAPEVPLCELPPRTLRVRNHNLPLEPNPLLGRAAELVSIRAFLESGRRLVTLTGPGGIGKTRLALQVAAELADRFADGVWFVSLTDVHNEEQLDAAIAEALGLEIRDSRVRFVETLAERRMLLVLDNFETVLVAAPRVAQLLRQAPGLVCLVTSQALLSLTGEWRFEVAPLVLAEAERLFIERALQVEHDLALTEADLGCIRRICQRLEGMPLAVELAAARRRLFSLEEIEARLDNALSLLVTRARDVPERQRTLRAALEWSFSLLDTSEQRFFLRLSILPGSFTHEAARTVCEEPEILEWLAALEEKSLLRREAGGRWRMLSIVRLFAQESLKQNSPELRASEEGLLAYCSSIARSSAQHLDTAKELENFKILEADFDIIRFSIELMQVQPPQRFAEYLLDLDYFLRRRRYLKELGEWCDLALVNHQEEYTLLTGRLLLMKAFVLRERESNEESIKYLELVVIVAKYIHDYFLYAEAISFKGIVLVRLGDYDQALLLYEEASGIYTKENNSVRCVRNLNNQAQVKIRQRKFTDAENDLEKALYMGNEIQCTRDLCVSMTTLGSLYYHIDDVLKFTEIMGILNVMFLDMDDINNFIAYCDNYYRYKYREGVVDVKVFFIIIDLYRATGLTNLLEEVTRYLRYWVPGFDDLYAVYLLSGSVSIDVRDLPGLDKIIKNAAIMLA